MPRKAGEKAARAHSPAAFSALILQGGGALGAYQAGAYEALAARAARVDWVAGISIGAINAALIAGNPAPRRMERLRAFWERVTLTLPLPPNPEVIGPMRHWWNDTMALWGACWGIPGFFSPRPVWSWWPQPPANLYDTAPLRETLLQLIDFDYLNDGPMRFSVGAVDVESGNFAYFDNRHERIGPEHVMASGALPPGFGAMQIDGRWYWDGGLVSNTPLAYVIDQLEVDAATPVTLFQIDLFSARGQLPHTLAEVADREKDIRFSSRTRMVSDQLRERHQQHQRLHQLARLLPEGQRNSPAVKALLAGCDDPPITLVHVIHRHKTDETQTKDYEFSRLSMDEHWRSGLCDMKASLGLMDAQPALDPGEFRTIDYQARAKRQVLSTARPMAKAES
ncbi:MAG: patatin-like phospholipase family protein [Proteobacteria bacterium]|nr:patatin-like phospholipase family protein [Pseudomonadota bacterium]HQR03599.1 patatin-like phospholipase family protein [Rhodocyclaceae bacterium]